MSFNASTRIAPVEADQTDPSVIRVRWFANTDNRREAFALRHRGYVAANLIEPSPWGLFTDAYDELPSTIVAALFKQGACIATLRLSFYAPGQAGPCLPCEKVYPEIAAIKAEASGLVVELSRLAIDPDLDNTRMRARLYASAVRAGVLACIAMDAKDLIVATQLKWRSFYEHILGFEVAGAPQYYPPGNVPVLPLRRRMNDELRRRIMKNKFFTIDDGEVAELRTLIPALIGQPSPHQS